MAEVDTSSYLKPGPPQNPLDQILKTGQAADVLGNIEVGKGIQQAIQPDGTIDRNILAQILKGSVAGSMQAPKALNALETLRHAGYAADTQGLVNFNTRMEHVGKAAAYIIENPTKDGVMKGFGYLANPNNGAAKVGLGIPQIADAQKEYYDAKGNLLPPAQIRAIAQRQATQAANTMEAIRMHLPGAENVDTGQRIVTAPTGTQMNPAIGRAVQKEIPPTAEQPGPNNQPTFRGTQPPSTGTDVQMPGQRAPQEDITKRILWPTNPTSGGKPVTLAQPGDGTQYGVPRGGAAALAPGQAEPLTASGAAYAKDLAESRGFAERMNPLKQAIPLLEKLGKTGVGPTTETIQHIKSAAQSLGLPVPNEKAITNYAEAKKYLSQNAAAVAPPGTNIPSVLNAFEANPNMQQPQQAAVELSKMLYGLGRLRQASVLAFQKTGLPAGQYTDWASKWAPQQDVRGYIADLMTPQQRKDLLKSVPKGSAQAAKVAESYKTAKSLDLLGDVERP